MKTEENESRRILDSILQSIEIESYKSMMSIREMATTAQLTTEERKIALTAVINKLQSMINETRRLV